MTYKREGMFESAAAILVLFTALLDPRISAALGAAMLIGFGLYHLLKKS
jgi:hypothetical protein